MTDKDKKFDFEAFKEQAMADLKAGKGFHGAEGAFRPLFKMFMESVLEGEMDDHLAEKEPGNRRNGKGKKRVRTSGGEVEIQTPRDRSGSFTPKLIAKRQKQLPEDLERQIFALYARKSCYHQPSNR